MADTGWGHLEVAMDVQTEPSVVDAEQGVVIVDGPDGTAISLTPEAAIKTAERLEEAAVYAQGQQVGERALADERARLGLSE